MRLKNAKKINEWSYNCNDRKQIKKYEEEVTENYEKNEEKF